ncbi:MAG: hypothetical protein DI576_00570 [Actinomyces sp.]|nr:MAG: hypothetical protein DI576_00570 [Actinomyces sp.]
MVWRAFFGAVVPGLGLLLRAAGRRSEVLGVPRLCRASRSSSTLPVRRLHPGPAALPCFPVELDLSAGEVR